MAFLQNYRNTKVLGAVAVVILTQLCLVDSSTITFWAGLFPIVECLVCFVYYVL